jgi:hypothetical protein
MKISRPIFAGCTALVLLSAGPGVTAPQQQASSPAQRTAAPAASADVDADALMALTKMGEALRSHNALSVTMDVTNEDVLTSGQKLQYVGTVQVTARRPDRFKMSIVSDIKNRDIYYDGKSVTVFSPRLGLYANFAAPGTIAQTLEAARDKFGVELPVADLFTWGVDDSRAARLTSGFLVRPEHIDGRACNHYAFRQQNVDWQIWIDDQTSLPCKLVITRTDDPSLPQYTAVMRWTFPTTIAESTFNFMPPTGSQKIAILELGPPAGGATR